MDSNAGPDRLSNLPEVVLVMIISCLPFKDCVRTSVLAKSWRYLYRETRNVAFKQSEFVSHLLYVEPRLYARAMVAFAYHMSRWIAIINDHPIDSLKICISDPEIFLESIQALIALAVQKRVKRLVLDFSDPTWNDSDDVDLDDLVVEVPESVYNLTSLESLKVWACKDFDPSRLLNPERFKSLSFGWMRLETLEPFLSNCSRLDSLRIRDCWDLGFTAIAGNMRKFAFENCDLFSTCTFDMPNLQIFRYSGDILKMKFRRKNVVIKEIYLDFEVGGDGDSTTLDGMTLCDNLSRLPSSRTLTLSPDVLEVVQKGRHPHLLRQVKTQHLVLRTRFRQNEATGIWLLLNSCPNLKKLTFDMLPPSSKDMALALAGIKPPKHWMQGITIRCLRETLKVLVVRNFVGGPYDYYLVENVIRCRHVGGPVLERVELYVPSGLDESQKMFAYAKADLLGGRWNDVEFRVQDY